MTSTTTSSLDKRRANPRPHLFSNSQYAQLIANGMEALSNDEYSGKPVVKLFTPDGAATWLLGEIYPRHPDIAFGLCDLGLGEPELGNVSLTELSCLRGKLGLPVERDRHFKPAKTLVEYAEDARRHGCIRT